MEKIYLKNYKGFLNQVVQLEDVNFLVGENSTGKTSLLKVINLLSSSEFWYDFEFNNSEVELGYFDEIINKQTRDKFFQIGLEKEFKAVDKNNNSDRDVFRINFEFHEEKSVPVLKQAKIRLDSHDILLKYTKKRISYRYKLIKDNSFIDWILDMEFPKTFKVLTDNSDPIPIGFLAMLVNRDLNKDSKPKIYSKRRFHAQQLYSDHKWIAPIRAKAKRTYESYKVKFSPEGDHIPSILREILTTKGNKEKEKVKNALLKFGKESNLFDSINIRELGKNYSAPFEIIIKYRNTEVKLPNVGYGVSQSLPLITEILSTHNCCFSIQQPEVHLHPKAQSAFGELIYTSTLKDKNKFIVETHSDFTIDRFRYRLSKSKEGIKSKVLFFQRLEKGNRITEININDDGTYPYHTPESYRDFFIDEELKMLEL